jgi:hypothetical protein
MSLSGVERSVRLSNMAADGSSLRPAGSGSMACILVLIRIFAHQRQIGRNQPLFFVRYVKWIRLAGNQDPS